MPRRMPPLAAEFSDSTEKAVDLSVAVEEARLHLVHDLGERGLLYTHRLELIYELAFLRLFLAWEEFLEESLVRYLCGYSHIHGQETLLSGKYYGTLNSARSAVRGGRGYVLWHNPNKVVTRARRWFDKSRHELVIASSIGRLQYFAAVRHRIAHSQSHARAQFDAATMALIARRYRGGRPGRFLRDWVPGANPPVRWLDRIGDELVGLAYQIVPS